MRELLSPLDAAPAAHHWEPSSLAPLSARSPWQRALARSVHRSASGRSNVRRVQKEARAEKYPFPLSPSLSLVPPLESGERGSLAPGTATPTTPATSAGLGERGVALVTSSYVELGNAAERRTRRDEERYTISHLLHCIQSRCNPIVIISPARDFTHGSRTSFVSSLVGIDS